MRFVNASSGLPITGASSPIAGDLQADRQVDVGDDREHADVLVVDRREEVELERLERDVEQRLVEHHVARAVVA